MKETFIGFSAVAIAYSLLPCAPINAQVVGDRTLPVNTIVNSQGKTYTITGGTQLGSNQFHSFQQFSIPTGSTAYFNNSSDVTNIISRVTGNSISNIDGLIKANGQANLFLVNPNGIIFGQNAQLQIGGSFTATTANSIKFADGQEFSATNPQAPVLTMSVPIGLQYGKDTQAAIVNQGNLSVNKDLTLSAGSVTSTGNLSALDGNLRVESVSGDVEVRDAIANTATFSANRNLILNSSQIATIGDLNLLAKDSVIARDTAERPFITSAGSKLTVQGDRLVDLFVLNNPNSGLFSGSEMVFRSANTIIGDAHYYASGNFRVEKLDGSIGNLESPNDPIIRSLGDVTLGVYLGRSLDIIAGGKVTIDAIQITNTDTTNNSIKENVTLSNGKSVSIDGSTQPTLDIRAGVDPTAIGTSGTTPTATTTGSKLTCASGASISCYFNSAFTTRIIPNTSLSSPTESGIKIGNIYIPQPNGLVLLTNNYKPNLNLNSGDIEITGSSTVNPITISGITGISISPPPTGLGNGNGGSLFVDSRGSIIMADNTAILASSKGANTNGGQITLIANNQINLGKNVQIRSNGTNLGGEINLLSKGAISTQGLQLFSTSISSTSIGNSGDIKITAASLNLMNSTTYASQIITSTFGKANAGNITLDISGNVNLDGSLGSASTGIFSQVLGATAQGNSGDITIKNASNLSITNGAQIGSNTAGIGNAGQVNINTSNSIVIDGKDSFILSQVLGTATGSGNIININTNNLYLSNFSKISSTVEGKNINSKGSKIEIQSKSLSLINESDIDASTNSLGSAGDITINTNLASFDRSFVSSSVQTNGIGNAGNLEITATKDISITDGAQITSALAGKGKGGQINIVADSLKIDGVGILTGGVNSTSGIFASVKAGAVGDGGNINIYVNKNISLSNSARISASTDANTTGKSGSIFIDPAILTLTKGSRISVSSLGLGDGGNISLIAGQLSLNGGAITAETANGTGGNISIRLSDLLWLRNASLVSATAGNNGNGGNIDLSASFILAFATENSDITANAFKGRGGNITITTQGIFGLEYRPQLTPLSDITASSQYGINGTVTINTPGVDPSKGLGKLPIDVTDSSKLLAQRCAADNADSKFFITGRGGLPPNPSDAIYRTTQILDNVGSVSSDGEIAQKAQNLQNSDLISSTQERNTPIDRIVEIQGWIVDRSGKVSLIAELPSQSPNWIWANQPKCISAR